MSDSDEYFSDDSVDFSEDESVSAMTDNGDDVLDDTHTPIVQDFKNEMPIDKVKKSKDPLYSQTCTSADILKYMGDYTEAEHLEFDTNLKKELLKKDQTLELVEGVTKCNKCKSNKIYTYQMQTRSGDEAMTTFYVCSVCASKWKT
tara:strand:+ start:517 stop:954 length:438 start_codon:yes stop_codon:yes gene_type:complete